MLSTQTQVLTFTMSSMEELVKREVAGDLCCFRQKLMRNNAERRLERLKAQIQSESMGLRNAVGETETFQTRTEKTRKALDKGTSYTPSKDVQWCPEVTKSKRTTQEAS